MVYRQSGPSERGDVGVPTDGDFVQTIGAVYHKARGARFLTRVPSLRELLARDA
jgi:hypothetical protein